MLSFKLDFIKIVRFRLEKVKLTFVRYLEGTLHKVIIRKEALSSLDQRIEDRDS